MKIKGLLLLIFHFLMVIILTVISQTGGIIYLLSLTACFLFIKKPVSGFKKIGFSSLVFLALYLSSTYALIPALAPLTGRVPLPGSEKDGIAPYSFLTGLLNRQYVKPELYAEVQKSRNSLAKKFPSVTIIYLDANFPFWDGFPLFPHLSHNDGEKLDLAFFYTDAQSGREIRKLPSSFLGYGVCEPPKEHEIKQAEICKERGYWQYSALKLLVSKRSNERYHLNEEKTRALLTALTEQKEVKKIFIEPHLKHRLGFGKHPKVRFHGCQAVRHDDHIHIQL